VQPYDSHRLPLEVLVERETRALATDQLALRAAAEAGQQFLRMLGPLRATYAQDYIDTYGFSSPDANALAETDHTSLRFWQGLLGRGVDGRRLFATFAPHVDANTADQAVDAFVNVGDAPNVATAIIAWVGWFRDLYSEPRTAEATWLPERLEYAFAVAAPLESGAEIVLSAEEYPGGRLDWYSFVRDDSRELGAIVQDFADLSIPDAPRQRSFHLLPAPLTYSGQPAPRWWEFENARVNFGAVTASAPELSRLLLLSFALIGSDDWFLLPVELDLGSLCRVTRFEVTNSFGETVVIPHSSTANSEAPWSMFQLGNADGSRPSPLFFLAPALAGEVNGPAIEEVRFVRDEMANYAWAVERMVQSVAGNRQDRYERYQEQRASEAAGPAPPAPFPLRYQIMTEVPDHWHPLLPVQLQPNGRAVGLRRGALLRENLTLQPEPKGRLLAELGDRLLHEEELPREGKTVRRQHQVTRWIGGETYLWIGRRKLTGKGEGSSGLRFDDVEV
jgi:hypothetical protein